MKTYQWSALAVILGITVGRFSSSREERATQATLLRRQAVLARLETRYRDREAAFVAGQQGWAGTLALAQSWRAYLNERRAEEGRLAVTARPEPDPQSLALYDRLCRLAGTREQREECRGMELWLYGERPKLEK